MGPEQLPFDLLQELIEARRRAPRKAARMLDLFFQLIGDRLLLPLNERHLEKAQARGVLSEDDRYVSREVRKDARGFVQSGRDASELIEDLYQQKVAIRESEQRLQQQMIDRLAEEVPVKQAPLMRRWIATVDIHEWVRGIADDPRLRERVPDYEAVRPEHLPSASAFVIARLGRLTRTMGERRKIQGSDPADAQHIACGRYYDVLVTDDKELRATLDLVRGRLSFEDLSSDEFFATLP